MSYQVRRFAPFDVATAGSTLLAPARDGHYIAVFSIVAQGHADGQTARLRGSADGSTFAERHWPIKCDEGSGGGESVGGGTPICWLAPGESLYLTTAAAARVAGNVVYDYLPGTPPA